MILPYNPAYPKFNEAHREDEWCKKAGCVPLYDDCVKAGFNKSAALPEGAEPTTCPEPSEDYELGRHEGILFAVDEFLADDDETYTQVAQRLMLLVENEAAKRESALPSPGAQPPSYQELREIQPLRDLAKMATGHPCFTNSMCAVADAYKMGWNARAERTSAVAPGTSKCPACGNDKKGYPLTGTQTKTACLDSWHEQAASGNPSKGHQD